ncbi:hypothetical protein [Lentzea sp. E54]|uniref:hypothetical protein n=1 Tax=Lentzea xerophila TaxID=3435883 RepID=UPI003DA43C2B
MIELHGPHSETELISGWAHESPLTPGDAGSPCRAGEATVVVLAACLSCCWPDPDSPVFPGLPTSLAVLRQTAAPLGIQNVTHAVNRLRKWGYLAPDLYDGAIRLGPMVAVWPEADLDRLRREHSQLPARGSQIDD